MGSFIELNDTLQLTEKQGFPVDIFNLKKHRKKPVTLKDVKGKVFEFKDKSSARLFHLDPVRVYYVHNIDGKWLFWGRVLIQSLQIEKRLSEDGTWDGHSWKTSGTYTIQKIYDPKFQKEFTINESPNERNYFKKSPKKKKK